MSKLSKLTSSFLTLLDVEESLKVQAKLKNPIPPERAKSLAQKVSKARIAIKEVVRVIRKEVE